jgi:HD superfamily phosphohydrolase
VIVFYSGVAGECEFRAFNPNDDCVDDVLVIEEKGIYSLKKFLMSRRLMYWQAYLHKTSLAAAYLTKILKLRIDN